MFFLDLRIPILIEEIIALILAVINKCFKSVGKVTILKHP